MCEALHPEIGAKCRLDMATHPPKHFAKHPETGEVLHWPWDGYQEPRPPVSSTQKRGDHEKGLRIMAQAIPPEIRASELPTRDEMTFDGETYEEGEDQQRLSGQMAKVFEIMSDGEEHGLKEVSMRSGGTEAAVSARLRDLRKKKFGGYRVDRRRVERGLFVYRLVLEPSSEPPQEPEALQDFG